MKLLIILSILTLSGCASISELLDAAGEANDKALIGAELTMCRAASIGSILRRYDTEAKATAWKAICTQDNNVVPIILNND